MFDIPAQHNLLTLSAISSFGHLDIYLLGYIPLLLIHIQNPVRVFNTAFNVGDEFIMAREIIQSLPMFSLQLLTRCFL